MRTLSRHHRSRSSRPLRLEQLEDRSVPAAYTLTDLGTLGGSSAHAYDLNEAGQVVGLATTAAGLSHAFLWQDGAMTDLGTLGGNTSWANAVNEAGQVIGTSRVAAGSSATDAFLWEGGVMAGLGASGGTAYGINDAGQVVGTYSLNSTSRAFLWDDGVFTDLGTFDFGGGGFAYATDINNAGQVVGSSGANGFGLEFNIMLWRATIWQNGVMTNLGVLPGDDESSAGAVNSSGQVVGQSSRTDPNTYEVTTRSFLWQNGLMTDLAVPGFESSAADINDSGQIVGWMRGAGGGSNYRAYLYEGGVVADLNALIPAGSGLTLTFAMGVNNGGQIVGTAVDAAGRSHAVLLTPVKAGTPLVSIGDATVAEGNTGTRTATFTLRLSAASAEPVTVTYATAGGTAAAGSDYQDASGTVTFAPGETTKTIPVLVNGDRVPEANETFVVDLSQPAGAFLADGQGVATIVDDEPRINIFSVAKKEGNSGTTVFVFTVTLSTPTDVPLTVNFATADGTAKAGEDYDARSGTLTFAPGETTQTISIVVRGDKKRESKETFFINLTGAVGAEIQDGQALGIIEDDDGRLWW